MECKLWIFLFRLSVSVWLELVKEEGFNQHNDVLLVFFDRLVDFEILLVTAAHPQMLRYVALPDIVIDEHSVSLSEVCVLVTKITDSESTSLILNGLQSSSEQHLATFQYIDSR